MLEERPELLRDRLQYNECVAAIDKGETYGIKEECVFNKIPEFDVIESASVDVMHDLLEGICRYDLALILHYFIYEKKLFSLKEFNQRLQAFNFGNDQHQNRQVEVLESHLTGKNKCIYMSSAKMLLFVKNLPLFIPHEILEEVSKDEVWDMYLLLKQIVIIACSPVITSETPTKFAILVKDYLRLLNKLFPKSMKPKHHYLLHYARIMKALGPPWNMACMRFEAFHKIGKTAARAAISRRNVCKTVALRHQLLLHIRLSRYNEGTEPYTIPKIKHLCETRKLEDVTQFAALIPADFENTVNICKKIVVNGSCVMRGSIIVIFEENEIIFHYIHLILEKDKQILFVTRQFLDVSFIDYCYSYKIENQDCYEWNVLTMDDVISAKVGYTNRLSDGKYYVSKIW